MPDNVCFSCHGHSYWKIVFSTGIKGIEWGWLAIPGVEKWAFGLGVWLFHSKELKGMELAHICRIGMKWVDSFHNPDLM